jgi:hypothetical protein
MEKLQFANAAECARQPVALDLHRLYLAPALLEKAGMTPVERIEMQRHMDVVTTSRHERATNTGVRSYTDEEYVESMHLVLPFAAVESATIIKRMLPHHSSHVR